jgi:hypothetical protein
MSRNVLLKFLLASTKIFTNSRYFTGSRIRSPLPPHPHPLPQRDWRLGASIQPLKLPIINHPPLIKSNTVTRFKISSGLRNSLQNHKQVPFAATSSLKRVTGRIFTISKCFHRSKPKLHLFFCLHNKAAKKFKNYRRIYVQKVLICF